MRPNSLFWLLLLALHLTTFAFRPSISNGLRTSQRVSSAGARLHMAGMFDPAEDEGGEFKKVVTSYLKNKYKDCKAGAEGSLECRYLCDALQIREILTTILPPVTKEELQKELDKTMLSFRGLETVDEELFFSAMVDNTYWSQAGPLVVKELIFLDALYHYYHKKQILLGDDEYNDLKEMITWEGSSIANLKGSEALFVTAVASQLRGSPILADADYDALKAELKAADSWVVARQQDSLEKLGLDTFLGYVHRSL